ncbi:Rv1733c family protein [Streptomyces sp. NPDC054833]
MRAGRRGKKWLWRWRANPLRRRDDVLEAWLVLAVSALIAVGGTLAGLVTARAADDVFAQQRAERTPVRAVLLTDASRAASKSSRALVKVRWTLADGSTHTGTTLVDGGQKAGSTLVLWTNTQGNLTTRPPSGTDAAVEAGFLGAASALAVTGLTFGVGGAARWWLDRRRIAQWGSEWDLVGPKWGHKTS